MMFCAATDLIQAKRHRREQDRLSWPTHSIPRVKNALTQTCMQLARVQTGSSCPKTCSPSPVRPYIKVSTVAPWSLITSNSIPAVIKRHGHAAFPQGQSCTWRWRRLSMQVVQCASRVQQPVALPLIGHLKEESSAAACALIGLAPPTQQTKLQGLSIHSVTRQQKVSPRK